MGIGSLRRRPDFGGYHRAGFVLRGEGLPQGERPRGEAGQVPRRTRENPGLRGLRDAGNELPLLRQERMRRSHQHVPVQDHRRRRLRVREAPEVCPRNRGGRLPREKRAGAGASVRVEREGTNRRGHRKRDTINKRVDDCDALKVQKDTLSTSQRTTCSYFLLEQARKLIFFSWFGDIDPVEVYS